MASWIGNPPAMHTRFKSGATAASRASGGSSSTTSVQPPASSSARAIRLIALNTASFPGPRGSGGGDGRGGGDAGQALAGLAREAALRVRAEVGAERGPGLGGAALPDEEL